MHLVMATDICRHLIIQAWLKDAVCNISCGPILMRLSVASRAVPPVAFLFIFQVYSGVGRTRRVGVSS